MTIETLSLQGGESALFGYGSLISMASLERTLGRRYAGPFIVCELAGWRRGWDVFMPNNETFYTDTPGGRMYPDKILYLNVRRMPESAINGVLFVLDPADLAAFDQREWIYNREDITDELRGVAVRGGRAYTYVAKAEYRLEGATSPAQAAVRSSYLQILEAGFADLGDAFRIAYENSSDPVPEHLIIADRR
jgi:hypothetical protein